ncbi:DUF3298 and DUF4163 domain-containing protein [Flavobacterium sp. ASW18X]|uniref:DUF3298 and DUF4163 domain-containing protein n=1 Tax=Flavobacterium sp. ASW18X TaxID=2572595 RepID=UPI0010AE2E59|nr:DUF3298 and DUF4163 domain-containing protein [Flavobacterium sp. ASW18X]TKD65298.1 DUF3298 and DUF4163 domain-containing protein [Flavobacterium sp. ASW18X]
MSNFRILLISIAFVLFSCEDKNEVSFENKVITGKGCTNCPQINIELLQAVGQDSLAIKINTILNDEVIALLNFNDEPSVASVEEAVTAFENSYTQLKSQFGAEIVPWEAEINAQIALQTDSLVTLKLDAYSFTGGAHGYSSVSFLNFNKALAAPMMNDELFLDVEQFTTFAEAAFRAQEKIPTAKNINATGFMFEEDTFHLPLTIGYGADGLVLWYNQYEIASYADGPVTLVLPYKEVNPYLVLPVNIKN